MTKRVKQQAGLKSIKWKTHLNAADTKLVDELYGPALERAVHYDRCCAYFSSSVLSAAARGFGGLVKTILENESAIAKPAVRLLVNEQLDPGDLKAMLATGDYTPIVKKLLSRFKTPKEALERKRLEILAWLVANGWLEVRVGLMRHGGGILHAKYGIITDAFGDSIAFMGSGNETAEGLLSNYEELRLFTSWKDRDDVNYYQTRFNVLWDDKDENVLTIPLPKAVEQKLIKLAPAEPPLGEPTVDKKSLAAAMMWQFIAAAPYLPNGEYACDATAMVDLWPHQHIVVEDTARAFPAGRLLCDEVGMGKTIEAILVLRRLICGRGVKRALLLVPAGLLKQWQDELREKGGLLVPRWEDGSVHHPDGRKDNVDETQVFSKYNVLLVSREWARLTHHRQLILAAPQWDLVLLDEAHAARRRSHKEGEFNSGNLLLELLRELQLRQSTRGIILLSGTPMQTQPWEPWDLLSVVGVGGKWTANFGDVRTFYKVVADLPRGKLRTDDLKVVQSLVAEDNEFPPPPKGAAEDLVNSLMSATGDDKARFADWLRRGAPLARRMHRNTRQTLNAYHRQGLLDYEPSEREVRDVICDYLDPNERRLYEAINSYIDERFSRLEREKSGKGLVMTIYRRRAVSSPYAFRCSLQRRLEACERVICRQLAGWVPEEEEIDPRDLADVDIEEEVDPVLPATPEEAEAEKKEIEKLLKDLEALGQTDSKFVKFLEVLDEITADGRSVLVFSEYRDTMLYLRDLLAPKYGSTLACFSGFGGEVWENNNWQSVSKAEITQRLDEGRVRVLVCTDAASEGLNLQAASALINYDLPWNPSKVEQRIGRIDRIGQRQKRLPIRNMFLRDSVDMRVYQVLRERCGLFEHFIGRMQPVLAVARESLRLGKPLVDKIKQAADYVDADHTISNIFFENEPRKLEVFKPPVTRDDIENALALLDGAGLQVRAKKLRGKNAWRVVGARQKSVEVTTDLKTLERSDAVIPLSAGSELLTQIADKMPLAANRVPLVIEEYASEPYRAVEVKWIQGEQAKTVHNFEELRRFIEEWDGSPPDSSAVLNAQQKARALAKKRVDEMVKIHREREEMGRQNQVASARARLMRELGITLRCVGSEDPAIIFRKQLSEEKRPNGRFHRAYKLLGGIPSWTQDELKAIKAYVDTLSDREKKARLTYSEVDAALDDPRWKVLEKK